MLSGNQPRSVSLVEDADHKTMTSKVILAIFFCFILISLSVTPTDYFIILPRNDNSSSSQLSVAHTLRSGNSLAAAKANKSSSLVRDSGL